MARAYYNEIDPDAVHALRALVADGVIAPGDVDDRSIKDVSPDDLRGYTQCHFFAGGGLWSVAARLAGWPDERPLWTGSCPCQPFSELGRRSGVEDDRHLWPQLKRLISKRRPPAFFGEQTAAAPEWVRLVRGDLEAVDYAVGCMPIEAASAGADHFRDRIWIVADNLLLQRPDAYRRECAPYEAPKRLQDPSPSTRPSGSFVTGPDGRKRRVEPGVQLLADAVRRPVAALRLAGNAIDPILASEVIGAFLDCEVVA